MDEGRFDGFKRVFGACGVSRRTVARGLAGLGLGAMLPAARSGGDEVGAQDAGRCAKLGKACSAQKKCCAGTVCQNGRCACAAGKTKCGTRCRNLKKDPNNCGACGKRCGAGQTCVNGQCRCGTGQTPCGGVCKNLKTDKNNCGACGRNCAVDETCSDGFCVQVVDENDPFGFPAALAADGGGTRFVADSDRNQIAIVSEQGDVVDTFGQPGNGDGQFDSPTGVAIAGQELFVVDLGNSRIQRFDLQGNHQLSFGFFGSGDNQFRNPNGIAAETFPNGDAVVFVADTGNHIIKRHRRTGFFLSSFGGFGTGRGELDRPVAVALRRIDGGQLVYVAELGNHRIQIFELSGGRETVVGVFGGLGSGNGQFNSPRGVAVAPDGTVWVADAGNDRIQQFTAEGEFIRVIGRSGSAPGQFDSPEGISVDADGTIHVADSGNDRIQRLKPRSLAALSRPEADSVQTQGAARQRAAGLKEGDAVEATADKRGGSDRDDAGTERAAKAKDGGSDKEDNGKD